MNRLLEIKLQEITKENGIRNRGRYNITRNMPDKGRKGIGQEQKTQDKVLDGFARVDLHTDMVSKSLKMAERRVMGS